MKIAKGWGGLGLLVACVPAWAQGGAYNFAEVTALAQGALAGQNVSQPIPGFELVLMKDTVVIYQQAFGAWQIDRLASADSATKTLSGALIMSLVDSSPQPFSLDTRISQFIPQYTGAKQAITIRQCFAHMAAMRPAAAIGDPAITLQQVALDIADDSLQCMPAVGCGAGLFFAYGGTSMGVAGAVAELAGQAPWNTLFSQRISGPLGMTGTSYVLSSPQNPRIAGGAESRARDFARFMQMLLNQGSWNGQQILSPSSVQAMFTRQTPLGVPVLTSPLAGSADYGVGVWLDQRNAQGQLVGALAAGARGFSAWIDFDDGYVGALSTDLSGSANVVPWLALVRNAAQEAIRQGACDSLDFNRDGVDQDPGDIEAFLSRYSGGPCLPVGSLCGDLDFNNDGLEQDPTDIEAFLSVYSGGPCL